jgi:hypothetical protein
MNTSPRHPQPRQSLSKRLLQQSGLPLAMAAVALISGVALFDRSATPAQAQLSENVCTQRQKYVKSGDWRTLESYWNATGHAWFSAPVGAEIKVLYGVGWFSKDRQKQKLDGTNKSLAIGAWSVTYARMQMKVPTSRNVTYLVCSGGVAKSSPKIPF